MEQPTISPEEEKKLRAKAAELFPGKSIGELTPEEVNSLFTNYQGEQDQWMGMWDQPAPQGKTVGPLGVYVGPNWGETLGNAVTKGMAGYQLGKSRREEKAGRKVAADVAARDDYTKKQDDILRAKREEEERRQWITTVLGRSYQ